MAKPGDSRTYSIIGAAIEVHRQFGSGFLEGVYHEALAIELAERKIPFERELELPIFYKNIRLRCFYRADFRCFQSVIVELKALRTWSSTEEAQILNYLRASRHSTALLLNFGTTRLEHKRFVLTPRSLRE